MSQYGALVTSYYDQQEAAAIAGGTPVQFATFAVGDGGGTVPVLSSAGTGLVNQVYSGPVAGVSVNNENPLQVDIQCPLPFVDANGNPIGDFWVREVAIYDQTGKQVAAGITNFEKTTAAQGQSSAYMFIVSIVVSNTNAVAVSPPSGAFATASDLIDVDACMADLLALIVYNARRRLASSIDAAAAAVNALLAQIELSNCRCVYGQDNGTADNYVITTTPAVASYGPDLLLMVDFGNPNATTTPRINVSGLGWLTIQSSDGSAVPAGACSGKGWIGLSSAQGGGYVARLLSVDAAALAAAIAAGAPQGLFVATLGQSSTANAIVATFQPAVPAGVTSYLAYFVVGATNTGPTTFDGTAMVDNRTGAALAGGELVAGQTLFVRVTPSAVVALTPAGPKGVFTATLSGNLTVTGNAYVDVGWAAPSPGTNPPYGTWDGSFLTFTKPIEAEVIIGGLFDVNCNTSYSGASIGLSYTPSGGTKQAPVNSNSPLYVAVDQSYIQASGSDHTIGGSASRIMTFAVGDKIGLEVYGSSQSLNFCTLYAPPTFLQVRPL